MQLALVVSNEVVPIERKLMPLWNISCPVGTYSLEDKQALSERITELYTEFGVPKFFVSVLFQELPKDSYFVGGEPTEDFVRIWIDQIARRIPDEARGWWMKRVRDTVAPFVTERGLRWEVHIDDTPRELWSVQGRKPPAEGSEDEKRWALENKVSDLVGSSG
jgi:phenylpyruvate tautomerase PptA (4-oxalocrotonate tautomerase family)